MRGHPSLASLPGHPLPGELAETDSFLFSQENRHDLDIWGEHHP